MPRRHHCSRHVIVLTGLLCAETSHAASDGTCAGWLSAQALATVDAAGLDEVSGISASHTHDGVLWVHNDAGGAAALYAIDTTGAVRAGLALPGAGNDDWEDIGLGPCPPELGDCPCLHVADIGSNDRTRTTGVIYRLLEPDPDSDTADAPQTLWFTYPEGAAHDAEALVVHPQTGAVVIITKESDGSAAVYGFPDAPPEPSTEDAPVTLEVLAWLETGEPVTGADLSPLGERLILRTENTLLMMNDPEGADWSGELITLPTAPGADGEAVSWAPSGDRLYLIDESADPSIWTVDCTELLEPDESDALDSCGLTEPERCGCASSTPAMGWWLGAGLLALARRRGPRVLAGTRATAEDPEAGRDRSG